VELYAFVRGLFAWAASVAVLWPVNVPLMALAYKIQRGPKSLGMEPSEFWTRSTFAALFLALMTVVAVGADYVLADNMGFPAGPVHLIVLMAYAPAAVWLLFVMFALDDLMQGLSVFMLYIFVPVAVLFVLNVFGLWQWMLDWVGSWLKMPTA
jgi:hypothetical protein